MSGQNRIFVSKSKPCSIAAVLLAAGLSRRMGDVNKLVLDVGDGRAMIRHAALTLLQSRVDKVVVVLGNDAPLIKLCLGGLNIEFIHNPDYEQGQATSIQCGLKAIGDNFSGVLIAHGDQPHLRPDDLNTLIFAFAQSRRDKILIPYHGEDRGTPIILPQSILRDIKAAPKNTACRKFAEQNPHLIERHQVQTAHFVKDVDTPRAYIDFLLPRIRNHEN